MLDEAIEKARSARRRMRLRHRQAKARLSEITTHEVSFVPAGANGRRYLLTKNAEQVLTAAQKADADALIFALRRFFTIA